MVAMVNKLFVLVLCLSAVFNKSEGLRCYSCSFTTLDTDEHSCMDVSDDTPVIECDYTYCIVFRQDFLDPAGVVSSFLRGCVNNPTFLNHEMEDYTFKYYYRACTSDLCNVGNGIQSVVGGALSPTPIVDGANLLVPGTGSATAIQFSALFALAISVIVMFLA